jgi:hypothetical protein
MARAIDPVTELPKLRYPGFHSKLYMAIHDPAIVFTARINQPAGFDTYDSVAELTWNRHGGDTDVGDYGDVLPDQTLWIGSAPRGYDIGVVRMRGDLGSDHDMAATATKLYISETSNVEFANDQYLTVVDDFDLWARLPRATAAEEFADYNVDYVDEHSVTGPVPILGPDAVVWLQGGTGHVKFDASDSWAADGEAIASTDWTCVGASFDDDTIPAPTITFTSAGTYRVSCAIMSNGVTFTAYRYVFVYDANHLPVVQFEMDDCTGDYDDGSWFAKVILKGEAARTTVRDRARCIIFSRDWYEGVEGSLGPVEDRENILMVGRIDGESIAVDPDQGEVSFEINGPQWWLDQITNVAAGQVDSQFATDGAAKLSPWMKFADMTVDKIIFDLARWRSTASRCMDIYPSKCSFQIPKAPTSVTTLWDQFCDTTGMILYSTCCDRYGRMFNQLDAQLQFVGDRVAPLLPTVIDLEKGDWQEDVEIERWTVYEKCAVELSAQEYKDGVLTAYGARSPGTAIARYGKIERISNVITGGLANCELMAGYMAGWMNNEYPSVGWKLNQNNKFIDIAPLQYVENTLLAADNERGIAWTDARFIPRQVSHEYDSDSGLLTTRIVTEKETFKLPAIEWKFPGGGGGPPIIPDGDGDGITPPHDGPPLSSNADAYVCVPAEVRTTPDFDIASPTWTDKTGTITGTIIDSDAWYDEARDINYVYVATADAIWKTADIATPTWVKSLDANAAGRTVLRVKCAPSNGRVYVLAYNVNAVDSDDADIVLYRSDNMGGIWTEYPVETVTDAFKAYTVVKKYGTHTEVLDFSLAHLPEIDIPRLADAGNAQSPWAVAWSYTASHGGSWPASGGWLGVAAATIGASDHYIVTGRGVNPPGYPYPIQPCGIVNNLLSGGNKIVAWGFLTDYFGTFYKVVNDYSDMPKEVGRTKFTFDLGGQGYGYPTTESCTWNVYAYVFYNIPSPDFPSALDCGKHTANVVYIGLKTKIIQSNDGGITWTDYITSVGAWDIECHVGQDTTDQDITFWATDQYLKRSFRTAIAAAQLLQDAVECRQFGRIASDPVTVLPIMAFKCTALETYDLVYIPTTVLGSSVYTRVAGISRARSLKFIHGTQLTEEHLYYCDTTKIWYSTDTIAWKDETGGWAGVYADGEVVNPLR